ncbi:unnamed protein product [marine sediment metagenome]|uniref:Uncharacterized protein n=1 Tax=marine sediment metagenome TaxID=412755 RepID=X0ZI34_9ZZZZ
METGDDVGVIRASAGHGIVSGDTKKVVTAARKVMRQLETLEADINAYPTGPLSQLLSKNPYDGRAAKIQQEITALVPQLARGVFGEVGVLTDQDIERYKKTIPNFSTATGAKKVLMMGLSKIVNEAIVDQLSTAAMMGEDVSGTASFVENILKDMDVANSSAGSIIVEDSTTGERKTFTPEQFQSYGGIEGFGDNFKLLSNLEQQKPFDLGIDPVKEGLRAGLGAMNPVYKLLP